MIKESIVQALNGQVNAEYYSAYLYLSMSSYAGQAGYPGIANWLFLQAKEELDHGTRIYRYILERGAAPLLTDVKAPAVNFTGMKDIFERILAHEKHVTALIDKIATLVLEEKDHAAYSFILWFVNEQVEEENSAQAILAKVRLVETHPGLLYRLDDELGARKP
ncbi:MAG: ferritin [Spirochaetales bacterium]|jgi:ferritin|nr:ferritin [Spirochaetales bacterium]